ITWIESTWTSWAKDQSISYEVLNVDDVDFSTVAKNALTSELIVVTCFNVPIARSLYLIRAQLQIQSPWCFYLHGLASFGLWPLFHWKIGELLTTSDCLVASCKRDINQLSLSLPQASSRVIPFGLDFEASVIPTRMPATSAKSFVYIGRISEQKNLHSL